MEEKIPTVESVLLGLFSVYDDGNIKDGGIGNSEEVIGNIKNLIKLHVKAALQAASENAFADIEWLNLEYNHLVPGVDYEVGIMRSSILESYPEDLIK